MASPLLARRPSTSRARRAHHHDAGAVFKADHLSLHKLKNLGVPTLTEQREAAGLSLYAPETAPRTYHRAPGAHDGGKQPKKQVRMNDDDFVRSHPLWHPSPSARLGFRWQVVRPPQQAAGNIFWKVPEVARELSLLFGGKEICDAKFKRIKPIDVESARKSGASCSSAPLPLDATEPRQVLELAYADNLVAIA
jgi:hypothetical protein